MTTKQDELIFACERALAGIQEVRTNAVKPSQLEQQIKEAQGELAGLKGQIERAKQLAPQLQEMEQRIRAKQTQLSEVDAEIARKNELHGKVDGELRDLRKRISGDLSHP